MPDYCIDPATGKLVKGGRIVWFGPDGPTGESLMSDDGRIINGDTILSTVDDTEAAP